MIDELHLGGLLDAARRGEEEAARRLDGLLRPALLRFAAGYLADEAAAEDVCQEVLMRLVADRGSLERPRAYVYRAARNLCLNSLRDRGLRAVADLPRDSELFLSRTGNLTRLVRAEERQRLAQALASLVMEQREVLELRYAEGLAREEIAEVLGVDLKLVKSRLYEGTKKLREGAADLA